MADRDDRFTEDDLSFLTARLPAQKYEELSEDELDQKIEAVWKESEKAAETR